MNSHGHQGYAQQRKLKAGQLPQGEPNDGQIGQKIGDAAQIQEHQRRSLEEPAETDGQRRREVRQAIVKIDRLIPHRHADGFIERRPGEPRQIAGFDPPGLLEMSRKGVNQVPQVLGNIQHRCGYTGTSGNPIGAIEVREFIGSLQGREDEHIGKSDERAQKEKGTLKRKLARRACGHWGRFLSGALHEPSIPWGPGAHHRDVILRSEHEIQVAGAELIIAVQIQ